MVQRETRKNWYKGVEFSSLNDYCFLRLIEDVHNSGSFKISQHVKRLVTLLENGEIASLYEVTTDLGSRTYELIDVPEQSNDFFAARACITGYTFIEKSSEPFQRAFKKYEKECFTDPCVFVDHVSNVSDIKVMFHEQDRFMKLLQQHRTFPEYPVDITSKKSQKIVKDVAHDCMHELFEAIHLLKNSKDHRATNVTEFDREKFIEELSDAHHFLIEIYLLCGISHDEMYNAFMKKSTINFMRITEGY